MSTALDSNVRLQREDIVVTDEIETIKKVSRNIGGITTFLGTGRELSKGENISQLNFEHYPNMAEKKLGSIGKPIKGGKFYLKNSKGELIKQCVSN